FEGYMRFGLHLRPEDVFWNIADPGWAYGLYFSVIGPLLLGQSFIMYDAKFDVQETLHLMKKYESLILLPPLQYTGQCELKTMLNSRQICNYIHYPVPENRSISMLAVGQTKYLELLFMIITDKQRWGWSLIITITQS